MSIRLVGKLREEATAELLEVLAHNPLGLSTSELCGTQKFHGVRTLSNRQIIRLLRESGAAVEYKGGQGARTFSYWKRTSA